MCVRTRYRYYTYNMTEDEYILLYEKCFSGTCTQEEQLLLQEYKDYFSLNTEWDNQIGDQEDIMERMYFQLKKSILKENNTKWRKLFLAAACLLIISVGCIFYVQNLNQFVLEDVTVTKIVPGSKKATLLLSDGSQIILDEYEDGAVVMQDDFIVGKKEKGGLVYNDLDQFKNEILQYNTIVVPRGGEYRLILADGSKVWLNSGSSLKYPVNFKTADRIVELTGEAYFEVAKNKGSSFIVRVKETEVEVLGTYFNVNSYNEDEVITLIEGAVKLKNGVESLLLKPGQSGVVKSGKIRAEDADIESVTSWKNGYFIFRDESLKSIMDKVSRWYDIDVEFRGGVENKEFYAKTARYTDFLEMLKNIELTGTVRFKIEGRRVIIMP